MSTLISGRARKLGDDIDTDTIIQSRRKRETLNPDELRHFLLESHDPAFAATVADGDILVAGDNFGCGSAMEVAVTVVLGAGIKAVLAKSFARTYFRNAINNGLLPIICDTDAIKESQALQIIETSTGLQVQVDGGAPIAAEALPLAMQAIVAAGGLVPYLKDHGDFPSMAPAANTASD